MTGSCSVLPSRFVFLSGPTPVELPLALFDSFAWLAPFPLVHVNWKARFSFFRLPELSLRVRFAEFCLQVTASFLSFFFWEKTFSATFGIFIVHHRGWLNTELKIRTCLLPRVTKVRRWFRPVFACLVGLSVYWIRPPIFAMDFSSVLWQCPVHDVAVMGLLYFPTLFVVMKNARWPFLLPISAHPPHPMFLDFSNFQKDQMAWRWLVWNFQEISWCWILIPFESFISFF